MRTNAKVNQKAVSKFKESLGRFQDISAYFDKAEVCLEEVRKYIEALSAKLCDKIRELENAIATVESKINEYQKKIIDSKEIISGLEDEISIVQDEMSSILAHISCMEEGNTESNPNLKYESLDEEESSLYSEISSIEDEISVWEEKKNNAESAKDDLLSLENEIHSFIDVLEANVNDCNTLSEHINEIDNNTSKKIGNACEKLSKIEQLISTYIELNMKIEDSSAYEGMGSYSVEQLFNKSETASVDINEQKKGIYEDLKRNQVIQAGGYAYEVDNFGRPISASGKLNLSGRGTDRDKSSTNKAERILAAERLDTDDKGHLIGHQFGGLDTVENLVPQDSNINQNEYKNLEKSLAKLVETGKSVSVNVIPFYSSESRRPDGIFFFYNVDGVSRMVLFPNEHMEG